MNTVAAEEFVLAECERRWVKVARVIGSALSAPELEVKDDEDIGEMLTQVIQRLVDQGRLEAAGDVSNWRESEIRRL